MEPQNPEGLPCVNCQKLVPAGEAKFFQKVFLCSECCETAERLYKRLEWELTQVRTILAEAVRLLLIQRMLHLGVTETEGATKGGVFKFLAFLVSLKTNLKEPGEPNGRSDTQVRSDLGEVRSSLHAPRLPR